MMMMIVMVNLIITFKGFVQNKTNDGSFREMKSCRFKNEQKTKTNEMSGNFEHDWKKKQNWSSMND